MSDIKTWLMWILVFSWKLKFVKGLICRVILYSSKYGIFHFPVHATCPVHPTLIDFVIMIYGEEYKLWSRNSEQFYESKFSSKTILIEMVSYFSHPITCIWLWNLDIWSKGYKKTKDSRDEIHMIHSKI
jgi:hypothetical protein